jgi:hypothetical protein
LIRALDSEATSSPATRQLRAPQGAATATDLLTFARAGFLVMFDTRTV